MVLTLFEWCFGGRQVILCGSFDGWIQHHMIMVEGSLTAFQTVCDVPPGHHQFRYLVDGVWRVDERIIHTTDEFGTHNNIIAVEEPRLIEADQGIMNIDSAGIGQDVASSSGSVCCEQMLPDLANEMDVTRCRLSMHLSSYKTHELIPNSGKVTVLDITLSVEEAFRLMYEQELAVVPLWDGSQRRVSGMLTAYDFILLLKELQLNRAMVNNEHSISAWKAAKLQLVTRQLIQVGPDDSLRDFAVKILRNKISTVPVSLDSSCQQLLHIACLAGLIKHICRHFENRLGYLPLLQKPVGHLSLGTWAVEVRGAGNPTLLTLRPNDLLSTALDLLIEVKISSIPITDATGGLVDVFSWRHIASLAKDRAFAQIQLDRTFISQVLQPVGEGTRKRYYTCTPSDSLYRVMELLSDPVVRRLIIIEPGHQRVLGIITLRDVFNFILNHPS